jgi:hypothetical protein
MRVRPNMAIRIHVGNPPRRTRMSVLGRQPSNCRDAVKWRLSEGFQPLRPEILFFRFERLLTRNHRSVTSTNKTNCIRQDSARRSHSPPRKTQTKRNPPKRVPDVGLLWLITLLFGASSPVIRGPSLIAIQRKVLVQSSR